ncbi:MAG: fibronectin type III domain-containing protein [Acidobacteriota bacterium]|jgi:hypothetical protein
MGMRPSIGSHTMLARILLGVVFMLAGHALVRASDATLTWDANTETDLAGYKVYYGTASGSYSQTIDVGNVTTFTVRGLGVGAYFFAVTAYNTSGLESGFSNEVFQVVPSQTFYYPHLPLSSSIAGIDGPVLTGVALTNPGGTSAAVEVTALDANGNMVTGSGVTNPVVRLLQPGEQVAAIDSQWFGSGSAADSITYARVDGTAPILGFFEILNNKLTILNGAEFAFPPSTPSEPQTTAVFPAIQAEGTWLQLVNANSASASVVLQLFDVTGAQIGWVSKTIDPQSTFVADAFLDLFPNANISGSEYIRVTTPPGVLPYEYIRGPSKSLQVLGAHDAMNGSTLLYSPQYAVGGSWRTSLSVVNLDSIDGFVTFTLFPDGGGAQISSRQYIGANGKIEIPDQSFFVASGSAPAQGYVTITSTGIRLAGNVAFGDSAGTAFSTTLPLVSNLDNAAFFGQLASDATYYTGIAVVNPQDSPTIIEIDIFQSDGSLAAPPYTVTIPAWQRSVMLSDSFPGLGSQSTGYIQITGSQTFASFVLFGTRNLTALSAVPAQQIIR